MDSSSVPEFVEINTPSFNFALRLARLVSKSPKTPQETAILTLIFYHSGEYGQLKKLESDFIPEIERFIDQPPRNQANQIGKVFLVACYVISRRLTKNNISQVQAKYIHEYINYASSQDWFEDPFLAYFCHFLTDDFPICKTTLDFFKRRYSLFIEKKTIAAIAQSFLVTGNEINEIEKVQGFQLFLDNWQTCTPRELAWILLGTSTSNTNSISSITLQLVGKLNSFLDEQTSTISGNSLLLDVVSLLDRDISQAEIDEFINSLKRDVKLEKHQNEFIICVPMQTTGPSTIDLLTFLLIVYALSKTGWGSFSGVFTAQKFDVFKIIKEREPLPVNQIALSKKDLFVSNILTITATLLLGITTVAFFVGVQLTALPTIDCSNCNFRDYDVAIAAFIWVGLLATQVTALFKGRSAISNWFHFLENVFENIRGIFNGR